jgi:hypothetical protein
VSKKGFTLQKIRGSFHLFQGLGRVVLGGNKHPGTLRQLIELLGLIDELRHGLLAVGCGVALHTLMAVMLGQRTKKIKAPRTHASESELEKCVMQLPESATLLIMIFSCSSITMAGVELRVTACMANSLRARRLLYCDIRLERGEKQVSVAWGGTK